MRAKQSPRQNDIAAWALSELNVSTPYVLDFKANDSIYLFDGDNVQRISPDSELMDKVREIEIERNLKIYAVMHDNLPVIGETYSFLCISPYQSDWALMVRLSPSKLQAFVYAYVYNVAIPKYSEGGYVALRITGGKLVRFG